MNLPYTDEQLYRKSLPKKYNCDATEAAFLLGGIGTGNVSIGARGELRDWEVFNRPGKGNTLPYTFFSIWLKQHGEAAKCRVLEAKREPPYSGACGFDSIEVAGLPHMDSSVLVDEYPFARVIFQDQEIPLEIELSAFTPLIPLDADNSGIPCAVFRFRAKNVSQKATDVSICCSLANAVGFDGYTETFNHMKLAGEGKNQYFDRGECRGLLYSNPQLDKRNLRNGSMALMTSMNDVTVRPCWLEGGWFDGIQDFWDDFSEDGKLEYESHFHAPGSSIRAQKIKIGSLGISKPIQPGEEATFEFVLTWYFPNRPQGWGANTWDDAYRVPEGQTQRNYYSRLFSDAWDVGSYVFKNLDKLETATRSFHDAMFSSTYPEYVIDALVSNISVLRSNTCFRIEDGTFLAFEGCLPHRGCCEGSCTHVWNYAQTMASLFPELEQSMRRVEFERETRASGRMDYRAMRVLHMRPLKIPAAVDGQLGTIIKLYRDWRMSGSERLVKDLWPSAQRALDFALHEWDTDGDFVLDGEQHNTYDIEFHGPTSLMNGLLYAALKAAYEITSYLGDQVSATKYKMALDTGSRKMDELLWNGEYYEQKIDDVDKYRYQYGQGCLSDQLLGQLLAHVSGLGYVLPKEHVKKAILSVFRHNFRSDFKDHQNTQRTYVLDDEKGLLLCTWPRGGRPKLPFVYSDEVWTGIEYQVAAHLIYEGYLEEGLTLVKAVRDRHDGYRRNPWCEAECGNHYVRSMASWAVLLALSGFECDLVNNTMSFNPTINQDNFATFWSSGKGWGTYTQKKNAVSGELEWNVTVLFGDISGIDVKANGSVKSPDGHWGKPLSERLALR